MWSSLKPWINRYRANTDNKMQNKVFFLQNIKAFFWNDIKDIKIRYIFIEHSLLKDTTTISKIHCPNKLICIANNKWPCLNSLHI